MDADGKSGRDLFDIGRDVKEWRKTHGYHNQEDFARDVGISKRQVQRIEQGESLPDWNGIYKLKEFMGVDYEFFVTSDMAAQKPARNKKPLDQQVKRFIRNFIFWHETTPYCDTKEDTLKALETILKLSTDNSK